MSKLYVLVEIKILHEVIDLRDAPLVTALGRFVVIDFNCPTILGLSFIRFHRHFLVFVTNLQNLIAFVAVNKTLVDVVFLNPEVRGFLQREISDIGLFGFDAVLLGLQGVSGRLMKVTCFARRFIRTIELYSANMNCNLHLPDIGLVCDCCDLCRHSVRLLTVPIFALI